MHETNAGQSAFVVHAVPFPVPLQVFEVSHCVRAVSETMSYPEIVVTTVPPMMPTLFPSENTAPLVDPPVGMATKPEAAMPTSIVLAFAPAEQSY